MRGIAITTAMLTVVLLLLAPNGKSATTSSNKHSLYSIIQWEKRQIESQRKIIKQGLIWRTLANYDIELVFLNADKLRDHRVYLKKLKARLTSNLRKYKQQRTVTVSSRLSAWLCIHSHEGSWNANTGNGYYGGLQMDYGFMSTYGSELLSSKGTANNWTPAEQIMVADRAYNSRGFSPWPNTAKMCGLL